MSGFKIKSIIPTASDGLYFSSNTNLFRMRKSEFSLVSSCDGIVRRFSVNQDLFFLCTGNRIYLNHLQHFIGSLKRSATAIDSCDAFFAIGNENVLEIWTIPSEYKFCLFTLQSKHVGHHRSITHIKILDNSRIVTASDDCSVRLFDIKNRKSSVIATLNDIPLGIHCDNDNITVTTRNGGIVFLDLSTSEYKN